MKTGLVNGVLDVTPTELVDEIGGGIWPAAPSGSRPPDASASRRSSRSAGST